jgi:putative transposase
VSRDSAGRYHISILTEDTITEHTPTEAVLGVDAGITSLYTLSTGEKISNPRHEKKDRARLARAQRVLSRKQKGSANRAKARLKVARVHARIVDRRRPPPPSRTDECDRSRTVPAVWWQSVSASPTPRCPR